MKMTDEQKEKKRENYMIEKKKNKEFRKLSDEQMQQYFIQKYGLDEK